MEWITFTPAHVLARMTARELSKYERVARKEYSDDEDEEAEVPEDSPERMPQIVKQVCDRFRMAIACTGAKLGPTATLPDGLIFSAAVLARDSLIALPPSQEGMTDPRTKEHNDAETEFKSIKTMPSSVFNFQEPAPGSPAASGGDPVNTW